MVVSQNKGTPIQTPNTIILIMGIPPKSTPKFGKPPYSGYIGDCSFRSSGICTVLIRA